MLKVDFNIHTIHSIRFSIKTSRDNSILYKYLDKQIKNRKAKISYMLENSRSIEIEGGCDIYSQKNMLNRYECEINEIENEQIKILKEECR